MNPRDLWYDVSPMRPDEFARQRADIWYRAEHIQAAYRKGRGDAEMQHRKGEKRKAREAEMEARLKARVGG